MSGNWDKENREHRTEQNIYRIYSYIVAGKFACLKIYDLIEMILIGMIGFIHLQ